MPRSLLLLASATAALFAAAAATEEVLASATAALLAAAAATEEVDSAAALAAHRAAFLSILPTHRRHTILSDVSPSPSSFDVVVYGATPAGISAAIAASDKGRLSVALVEPLLYVGGMGSPGGLGLNDQIIKNFTIITGLARAWCYENGLYYTPNNASNCVHHPDNYVAEASYLRLLNASSVSVFPGCILTGAARSSSDPASIASITADCSSSGGSPSALFASTGVVIDASYDGDVMVKAGGIDYTWGRESNTTYGEPMAGVFVLQESEESFSALLNISAVDDQGQLLPGIEAGSLPPAGSGDDRLMAFQHRACVSTDADRVPFPKPANYDRTRFTLLQRVLDALVSQKIYPDGPTAPYFGLSGPYAPAVAAAGRNKTIVCCGAAAVMSDEPGLNRGWANASSAGRAAMWQAHADFLQGFFYYLATDPAVPAATRASFQSWGLCSDEWVDASPAHWPPQLYVRVSNRLVGDTVLTQQGLLNPQSKPGTSVSCALWELDAHITSRWAVPNSKPGLAPVIPFNEGFFRHSANPSVDPNTPCGVGCEPENAWFDVPFTVLLPKRAQCSNLLVPVAISASAVAYTAARIETMFSDLGTAAGLAARIVVDAGGPGKLAVQDVDVSQVQAKLVSEYAQRVRGPYWA
jgi:hypothetical protein